MPSDRPRKPWSTLFRLFGLVLMVILLVALDWRQVVLLYARADPFWLVAACLANLAFYPAKGVRWWGLLTMVGISYPWRRAIPVYMAGSFLGAVTPGRVADLVKASYLHQDLAVPYPRGIVTVVMDRLLDLALLMVIALAILWAGALGSQYFWPVLLLLGILTLATTLAMWRRSASWLVGLLCRMPAVGGLIQGGKPALQMVHDTLSSFGDKAILLPVALSMVAFALMYGGGYCLAQGLGLMLGAGQVVYVMTLSNLVVLLPITVAGIGTRDLAMILLFGELGLPPEQALAFSMGTLVVNLLVGNAPGCLYWFWRPVSLSTNVPGRARWRGW